MARNRSAATRMLPVLLVLVLLILIGLAGFYFYLTGGQGGTEAEETPEETGFIHVRTIYTYADGEPLLRPVGVGVDENGDFYVTLRDEAKVVKFDNDGDYITYWGDRGARPGNLLTPMNVAADALADHVYVADRARLRLLCFTTEGEFLWEVPLLSPLAPAVGPDGNVVVATFGPLVEMSSEGEFMQQSATRGRTPGQFDFPRSIDIDEDGAIYVADTNNTRVQRVRMGTEITATVDWVVGEPPRFQDDPDTRFIVPSGIALDEGGRVIVMDGFAHTFTMLDKDTGEEVYEFGERHGSVDGTFNLPTSIAHLGGDYFVVTDTFNDRVQIIRLLAPGEATLLRRFPWLLWLTPLLLLLLLPFLGRKRYFATEEALQRAVDEENARLMLAVTSPLRVLPDVYERFKDVIEEDVRLGDYLEPVEVQVEDAAEEGAETSALTPTEALLARAAEKTTGQKMLLARHRVVCADEDQCARFEAEDLKTVAYDEVTEDYTLESTG